MVGAGGIGCELLKTLALSGFEDIHIVSLPVWLFFLFFSDQLVFSLIRFPWLLILAGVVWVSRVFVRFRG